MGVLGVCFDGCGDRFGTFQLLEVEFSRFAMCGFDRGGVENKRGGSFRV